MKYIFHRAHEPDGKHVYIPDSLLKDCDLQGGNVLCGSIGMIGRLLDQEKTEYTSFIDLHNHVKGLPDSFYMARKLMKNLVDCGYAVKINGVMHVFESLELKKKIVSFSR